MYVLNGMEWISYIVARVWSAQRQCRAIVLERKSQRRFSGRQLAFITVLKLLNRNRKTIKLMLIYY